MMKSRFRIELLILMLTVALVACASKGGPDLDLSWPGPPAQPRVRYDRSIYGTASLKRSFGGRVKDFLFGRSPDQYLSKPYGVSSNGRSVLYVADTGKKEVVVLDLSAGTSKTIRDAGPQKTLQEPVNVIPDRAGNVYVADTRLGKIAVYNSDLVFTHYIGEQGQISSPVGMAIQEELGRIYVVDSQRHQVHIFTLDGGHVGSFGRRGDERGEFYHPLGIAINRGDTVYVTDAFHFAVQAFDLEGNYLFSFGPRPRGVGTMARPRDVAVDTDGHVYVTDALKHELQVYDSGGAYLFSVGSMGADDGQFRLPAGVCITNSGRIFVSDSINRRIQEFVYLDRG
jgi:DNA-binding beta-propeller fold protein YncE